VVGVYLDTFHDRQRASFFFSTPLGIQGDGIITETGGEDSSFDTQWDSRGKLTDDGYVVLITVPFKALRFPVKTVAARHPRLQLGRFQPLGRRSRGRPACRRRHPADMARASGDGALHRLHRRLRHRRDRSDAAATDAGRRAAFDRAAAVRQIELAVPVLVLRPAGLA
jgi:hypothetical protein